jgi:carbonic anhydrase
VAGSKVFEPRYFAAHIPPENVLPGHEGDTKPDMEVQLFHESDSGETAVVSFFFKASMDDDTPTFSFLDTNSKAWEY